MVIDWSGAAEREAERKAELRTNGVDLGGDVYVEQGSSLLQPITPAELVYFLQLYDRYSIRKRPETAPPLIDDACWELYYRRRAYYVGLNRRLQCGETVPGYEAHDEWLQANHPELYDRALPWTDPNNTNPPATGEAGTEVEVELPTADTIGVSTAKEVVLLGNAITRVNREEEWETDTAGNELVYTSQHVDTHSIRLPVNSELFAAEDALALRTRMGALDHNADGALLLHIVAALSTQAPDAGSLIPLKNLVEVLALDTEHADRAEQAQWRVAEWLRLIGSLQVCGTRMKVIRGKPTTYRGPIASLSFRDVRGVPAYVLVRPTELTDELLEDNHKLEYLGMVGKLLQIPDAHRPSGKWARSIGLSLLYWWRLLLTSSTTEAAGRKITWRTFSLRELLVDVYLAEGLHELLAGRTKYRAKEYLDEAFEKLKDVGILADAVRDESLPYINGLADKKRGWKGQDWLRQQFSVVPAVELMAEVRPIRKQALEHQKEEKKSPRKTKASK